MNCLWFVNMFLFLWTTTNKQQTYTMTVKPLQTPFNNTLHPKNKLTMLLDDKNYYLKPIKGIH